MKTQYSLPPGSRVPSVIQFWSYGRDAVKFLEDCRARFGTIFRCRFPWQPPVVVISDSRMIDSLLKMDPDQIPPYPTNHAIQSIFGRESTLFKSGEAHRRDRDLLTPYLNTTASEAAKTNIDCVLNDALNDVRETLSIYDWAYHFSLNLTLRLFWECSDPGLIEQLQEAVHLSRLRYETYRNMVLDTVAMSPERYPWLSRIAKWTQGNQRDQLRKTFEQLIRRQVELIRGSRGSDLNCPLHARLKVLGDGPVDDSFVDFAMQLLIAAYDPPAATISWLLLELGRAPEYQQQIRGELERSDTSPMLEACIQEVYRLYPPLHSITRTLTSDTQLGEYFLPAGSFLLPSIYLLHREPEHWVDPAKFQPERFQDQPTRTIKEGFLPFGGNVRVCPGRHFATVLMREVCKSFINRFNWSTNVPSLMPPRTLGPTLVPDISMTIQMEKVHDLSNSIQT